MDWDDVLADEAGSVKTRIRDIREVEGVWVCGWAEDGVGVR